jgi:hypothetical protein
VKAFQMLCDTSAQSGNDQYVFIAFWLLVSNKCVLTYGVCILKRERERENEKQTKNQNPKHPDNPYNSESTFLVH